MTSELAGDTTTARDWTDQLANTVRPITTFVIVGVFAWMSIAGKLSTDAVVSTIAGVVTFWFVQRQQTAATAATTAAVAALATPTNGPKSPPPTTG